MLMNLRNMPLLTGTKKFDSFIRVYFIKLNGSICIIRYSDCSIRVYRLINIIFLKILPIMLALCLMLLVTYYAFNYASIIGLGLITEMKCPSSVKFSEDLIQFIIIQLHIYIQNAIGIWCALTLIKVNIFKDVYTYVSYGCDTQVH